LSGIGKSDFDFTKPPFQVADLANVECLDDFCFCDGLEELELLHNLLENELVFVEGSVDRDKVKNRYTVLYENILGLFIFPTI
jgi:hypothetical protein